MNKNPFNSYYLINARENLGIGRTRSTGKRSLSQTEGAAKALRKVPWKLQLTEFLHLYL